MAKPKITLAEKRELCLKTLEDAIEEHKTIYKSDYEEEVRFLTTQICFEAFNRSDKKRVEEIWKHINHGK